ncbi:bola protein [Mycena amicta]|nr:bola protein [Mycena amicta]
MPIDVAQLEAAIRKALNCIHIEIHDTSSGCGESYAIVLVSEDFEGKSTLVRHRWINQLLKDEIAQMHAFSQPNTKPSSPKEHNRLYTNQRCNNLGYFHATTSWCARIGGQRVPSTS